MGECGTQACEWWASPPAVGQWVQEAATWAAGWPSGGLVGQGTGLGGGKGWPYCPAWHKARRPAGRALPTPRPSPAAHHGALPASHVEPLSSPPACLPAQQQPVRTEALGPCTHGAVVVVAVGRAHVCAACSALQACLCLCPPAPGAPSPAPPPPWLLTIPAAVPVPIFRSAGARRVDMKAIEATIQNLIGSGLDPKLENNPYLTFVYTSFQVCACCARARVRRGACCAWPWGGWVMNWWCCVGWCGVVWGSTPPLCCAAGWPGGWACVIVGISTRASACSWAWAAGGHTALPARTVLTAALGAAGGGQASYAQDAAMHRPPPS